MSISRAQASAMADGFINSIGSGSKSDLQPRETFTEIILIAGELVEDAQKNLIKSRSISSGELSASLRAEKPLLNSGVLSVDIYMNFYGLFVNKGVKGTRSGGSLAGYSFKNENPSKKMVAALSKWIERAHISTRTVKKYSPYGRHETKQRSIAEIQKGSAYAISKIIKQKGLKPTGFFDKAVKTAVDKIGPRLGAALKIDVITSLT